jgi:predicted MFS family arabinose efflux permease
VDETGSADRAWWAVGAAVAVVGWGAQQFAPLLLLYRAELGVSTTTVQAVFVTYVVGLVPGLLCGGPVSDRFGRRPVLVAALAASAAASALLLPGGIDVTWLFLGRLVAGFASGAAFSAGAVWIKELSGPSGARRVTVAMTAGFGLGPLVAGVLAHGATTWWSVAPTVLPYLPHLVLAPALLPLLRCPTETRPRRRDRGHRRVPLRVPDLRSRRFIRVVVPLAPWVFGSASIAMAYLPGLVEHRLGGSVLLFSTLVMLLCAAAGIAVVPLARRVATPALLRVTALGVVVVGLATAAVAAATAEPPLVVVAAVVLGAGYGYCQVAGLQEVQRIASAEHLAGLTVAYQAISYLGFAVSYPLAAVAAVVSPVVALGGVAVLAGVTLLAVVRTHDPEEIRR